MPASFMRQEQVMLREQFAQQGAPVAREEHFGLHICAMYLRYVSAR
jgi:hypothetical protein